MSTLGTLSDQIEFAIDREDLTSQVHDAIRAAVDHFNSKGPFWFQESRGTLTTSVDQEYYTGSITSSGTNTGWEFIKTSAEFLTVRIDVTNGKYLVQEKAWAWMDTVMTSDNSVGDPVFYARFGEELRFWPVPNAARVIRCTYYDKYATLSATTDTNNWLVGSRFQLIKQKALYEIFTDIEVDLERAQVALGKVNEWEASLISEHERRVATGKIVPRRF